MKKNKKIAIVFGFISCLLVFCIILQIKTVNGINSPVLKVIADDELRDEVLKWKDKYDTTLKQLEKSEKKLDHVRKKVTQNDSDALAKQDEIKNNNDVLGLTDVTGPGVVITIKSNNIDSQIKEDIDSIINELKNAGAESIDINEERIVFNSVITCQENVIEVNGVTIQSPFVIQAIGDSKLIYSALMRPGGYVELLNSRGRKTEVIKANKINIKKYNGKFNVQYMKTIE
jgi:uncharacterized protein YlxW (UPF0749 family)